MGEEFLDVDMVVRHELGALGLSERLSPGLKLAIDMQVAAEHP